MKLHLYTITLQKLILTSKAIALVLILLFSASFVQAADRYSVATGLWSAASTWSATSGGAPGAVVPTSSDNVIIERGYTVTISATGTTCASLTIGGATAGTLNITGASGDWTVTVSGNVTINSYYRQKRSSYYNTEHYQI